MRSPTIVCIFLTSATFAVGQDVEYFNCPIASRVPDSHFRDVSALGVAALVDSLPDLETFLDSGCDVNYNGTYYTEEETECVDPVFETLGIFCKRSIKREGYTPLNLAAIVNNTDVIKRLLEVPGIDVNASSTFPSSPLANAASNGNLEALKLLVEAGADIDFQYGEYNLTALIFSIYKARSIEMLEYLVDRGADLEAETTSNFTAAAYAAEMENTKFIKILDEAGADLFRLQGSDQGTLLHLAAQHDGDHVETVKYLIEEAGLDINILDADQRYVLNNAARTGNVEVAKYLIDEAGADVNSTAYKGFTPLIIAVDWKQTEIVKLLIERGADVDGQDNEGFTPVYYATQKGGNLEILKILVEAGADLDIQSGSQLWSPIMKAAYDGTVDIFQYLMEQGADLTLENVDGENALDLAQRNLQDDIVKLLKEDMI